MLALKHTNLEVYRIAKEIVIECYAVTRKFPVEERYGLAMQLRRAAASIKLNISEGASRKSAIERRRFFEISRGSLNELASGLETAVDVGYINAADLLYIQSLLLSGFRMLSKLIANTT